MPYTRNKYKHTTGYSDLQEFSGIRIFDESNEQLPEYFIDLYIHYGALRRVGRSRFVLRVLRSATGWTTEQF
jgi:hypothetical protein